MKLTKLRPETRQAELVKLSKQVPKISESRKLDSWHDKPFDLTNLSSLCENYGNKKETVLYLGYGSNLSAETFLGKRGIRPLSQANIVAPTISLSFDLPGVPYSEPCFGNTRPRDIERQCGDEKISGTDAPGYHKNAWKKGLVGVVYEVTKADFAHIIATEGGGAGYHDVLVDCYVLSDDPAEQVPWIPTGTPFKAHTLYAQSRPSLRPDPDYAQPSPRYLKLITDGAAEHDLPAEYRHFLENIRTYHATTTQQQLGLFVFLSIWGPIFAFVFGGGGAIFLKPDGTYPKWFATFLQSVIEVCWASYDHFFKPTFGDGERTIGDSCDTISHTDSSVMDEKTPLLSATTHVNARSI